MKQQTYPNIEIIVVNDCSTEPEYYTHDWSGIKIIHLEKNSKQIYGFACVGHVRNKGIEQSTGKYIAFCDDDDIFFPCRIEKQIQEMIQSGCKMAATDGYIGHGIYDENAQYRLYNAECHFNTLRNIYLEKGVLLVNGIFPRIWTLDFLKIHNCVIASSVLIEKEILTKINNMKCISMTNCIPEDYDCWLRALEHTNCVYLPIVGFYYDAKHGHCQNR
jgi:glycosyltransferase involved in cell wall biosynthesis